MTVFHEAARDGYLDILREATRRDCEKTDEDGMTPILWAAYHGNLDALRMLSMRGGNPDKCDYQGNSALHLAARSGHVSCISYLVSFGCNMWALDNDFRTPLDVAGLYNHTEVVKYLDTMTSRQTQRNKKLVKKFKEKAVFAAQKRIKKYSKLQAKAQKKAERTDQKLAVQREKMLVDNSPYSAPASVYSTLKSDRLSGMSFTSHRTVHSEPKPYSAHFTLTAAGKKTLGGNVSRKLKERKESMTMKHDFKVNDMEANGTQTLRSLGGLKRDPQILYTNSQLAVGSKPIKSMQMEEILHTNSKNKADSISRAISEPDFANFNEDSGVESGDSNHHEGPSLFERPGFGSVAFMNKRTTTALMSIPWQDQEEDSITPITNGYDSSKNSPVKSKTAISGTKKRCSLRRKESTDSIGTLGSLAVRIKDVPWDESDLDLFDDDETEEGSPLELFLSANGLTEFLSSFTKEKIDLDAVMLLTDSDMKDLGLPLGPRKKLSEAIYVRMAAVNKPGAIFDTRL